MGKKNNLYKTDFISIEESEDTFQKMIEALDKSKKENPEYYDLLMRVMLSTDGTDYFKQMLNEVVIEYPELFEDPLSQLFNKK